MNQPFLVGTTVYAVIPSLMVFLALILRPRVNRMVNTLLAVIVYYAWTWPKQTPDTSVIGT